MIGQAEWDSRRAAAHRHGAEIGRQMRRDGVECPVLPEPPSPDLPPAGDAGEAIKAAVREGLVEGWHAEDQSLREGEPAEPGVDVRLTYAELEALRQLLAPLVGRADATRAERSLTAKVAALLGP